MIVPFPAGGPTDIVARPLAQALGDALKATLVVDNRGGAGGSIGANAVAKSAADGRTLLMATVGTQAINPALYKSLPYDAVRDFTPIALVAVAPVARLEVRPASFARQGSQQRLPRRPPLGSCAYRGPDQPSRSPAVREGHAKPRHGHAFAT